MSALVDKQSAFAQCVALLLQRGGSMPGVQLTLGDAYRDPRVPYGHAKSCHRVRLAIDINLYVDEVYITGSTHPVWQQLGDYWESLDSRARWGGQGSLHPSGLAHDGNHFSFEHEGVE